MMLEEKSYSLKELAEWFGISYTTIRRKNAKDKYLEKLKLYCDYEIIYGNKTISSINVIKVNIPEYSKSLDIIKKNFRSTWHNNNIDTCTRVGSEIYYKSKELQSEIKEKTAQQYASKVKVEMYGHNYKNDRGTRGQSRYCWCKYLSSKDNVITDCVPLTQDEEEIINNCSKEAFGSRYSAKAALLSDALKKKEITWNEFNEGCQLTEKEVDEAYTDFVNKVIEKLGYFPDKATLLEDLAW